jgi:hypothetical protein
MQPVKAPSKLRRLLTGEPLEPHRVELFTLLTPAECVARLAAVTDRERSPFFSLSSILGVMAVAGHVTKTSLNLRKRVEYRSPSQWHLVATMRAEAGGTVISGEVATYALPRAMGCVSFPIFLLIFAGAWFNAVRTLLFDPGVHSRDVWAKAIGPPAMLIFMLGMVKLTSHLARNEPRFLTDFVIETLGARPYERPA